VAKTAFLNPLGFSASLLEPDQCWNSELVQVPAAFCCSEHEKGTQEELACDQWELDGTQTNNSYQWEQRGILSDRKGPFLVEKELFCIKEKGPFVGGKLVKIPRNLTFTLIAVILLLGLSSPTQGAALNSFISYYEPAYYDTSDVVRQLSQNPRAKRQVSEDSQHTLKMQFTAHKRLFRVRLRRSAASIFTDDIQFENSHGSLSFNTDHIYSGYLEDDESSEVDGIVDKNGLFDGQIITDQDTFYVEPANRYFSSDAVFPTVIYRTRDVVHPHDEFHPKADATPCSSHHLHLKTIERWMMDKNTRDQTQVQSSHKHHHKPSRRVHLNDIKSAVIDQVFSDQQSDPSQLLTKEISPRTLNRSIHNSQSSISLKKPYQQYNISDSRYHPAYSAKPDEENQQLFESLPESPSFSDGVLKVKEVSHTANIWEPNHSKSTKLYRDLHRSSHRYKHKRASGDLVDNRKSTCMLYLQADHLFFNKMGGSEEACIETMTRHVQRVNSIFRLVDFDLDGKPDNISFMIKRIKVHTKEAVKDPKYRFPGNYGVEKFLEIFSEEDYDAFCLAYMFTYRDFEGGTLGLAWTGDLKNAGGVCEKNGHYRGSFKSLNTGIITLLNYGKHVPPAVSHVTMAHEMGHNFGSPHDPENNKDCVPGGDDGNYIMFARATSGDKNNNKQFSPCSLKSINEVLRVKARGPKGCFKEPQVALCGNGVVEDGEECDCGWEEDCQEECCWPQRTKYTKNQLPCTLRPNRKCSPSQGPCCTKECGYNIGNKCRDDNGCRDDSYCNGGGTHCPNSNLKPNKTVCNEEFVCFLGECTGSICLAYGMESCQCQQGQDDSPTKACELCCKEPGENKPCLSSFELNEAPWDVPDMYSKPGTPCNQYQGYCDVFQKCREVDPSGPLATLRKLLLSDKSIATLKKFLIKYWYTTVIAFIAVFALMVTIVKLCGKKTPLVHHRRRRRTIHHDTGPVMGDPDLDSIQVHPTAIKSNIPFVGGPRNSRDKKRKQRSNSRGRDEEKSKARKQSHSKHRDNSSHKLFSRETSGETSPEIVSPSGEERALNLASNLTKLIVALPPENANEPGGHRPSEIRRKKSQTEKQSHERRKSARKNSSSSSSTKEDNVILTKENEVKKSSGADNNDRNKRIKSITEKERRSRSPEKRKGIAESVTTLSKSFEKLDIISGKKEKSKNKKTRQKDSDSKRKVSQNVDVEISSPEVKEVTIAKLGPFKMSVERKAGTATQPTKPVERSQSRDKKKSRTNSGERRKKVSSKGPTEDIFPMKNSEDTSHTESEVHVSKKEKQLPKDQKQKAADIQPIIERKSRKDSGQTQDKIIFSKMAKSDRPLRERSPEKRRHSPMKQMSMDETRYGGTNNETEECDELGFLDYRQTLNRQDKKKSSEFKPEKFQRSISQPGMSLDSHFSLAGTSEIVSGKKDPRLRQRNFSFAQEQRPNLEKVAQLKRSSTTREQTERTRKVGNPSSDLFLCIPDAGNRNSSDGGVYDNLGFDGPETRQQNQSVEKRQQTIQNLKDQIQTQFQRASATTEASQSLNSTFTRKRSSHRDQSYEPMNEIEEEFGKLSPTQEEPIESDSDSSSDPKRKSPPTQVQSLSEESSGGSSRRNTKSSPITQFDSSDSDPDIAAASCQFSQPRDEMGEVKQQIPRKGSRAHLIRSDSDTSSDYDDILQFASNPYVRVAPNLLTASRRPPMNIQSLDLDEENHQEIRQRGRQGSGCDSDSTLDRPMPSGSPRHRRQRQREWSCDQDLQLDSWNGAQSDTDGDNISILTDGIPHNKKHTNV